MSDRVAFDETGGIAGDPRDIYREVANWFLQANPELIGNRKAEAEAFFRRIGITFAVYGDEQGAERIIPFDILPRILSGSEWDRLSEGLEQRVKAINAFIGDVYGAREIVKAGIVPEELILSNPAFRPEMTRIKPAHGIYSHIAGIDLVRTGENDFFVLEDNARTPSGVSYMMENREAMLRLFPELFNRLHIKPVDQYPDELLTTLRSVAPPAASREPNVVVLTPGPFNSAYYEHSFLADMMGVELVEGSARDGSGRRVEHDLRYPVDRRLGRLGFEHMVLHVAQQSGQGEDDRNMRAGPVGVERGLVEVPTPIDDRDTFLQHEISRQHLR